MPTKVGNKGQVVIEKHLRDELGIEPGFVAVQRLTENGVEIRFFPAEHSRSLRGVLADAITRRPENAEDWEAMRELAWAEASRREIAEPEER